MNESLSATAAVLTGPQSISLQNFPVPALKPGELLVEVEACGICGTDVHEYKRDPFGLIPVVLGHEGTGRIVDMESPAIKDFQGRTLAIGDPIVTSILVPPDCPFTHRWPHRSNLSEGLGVYGLFPDSAEYHLNGFFSTHIVIRANSTVFQVPGMSWQQRILIEPLAVTVHALERAKTIGLLDFASSVVVQGCGPIGLMMIATLHAYGISRIIAIDSVPKRLEMALRMGAESTLDISALGVDGALGEIQKMTSGFGADFGFQCTGAPAAAASIWKLIRRGGGLCEVGFFMDNGDCTINPHHDICKKEITVVGSWVYTAQEYPIAIAMIRHLSRIGLPVEELITHAFALEEINAAMETNIAMDGIKIAIRP